MRDRLVKTIQDIAPVLAGFQITVTLVGSIGLGAIANWIIVYWVPFTRIVWTHILQFINSPDISPEEKDALTAAAFFLPMALSTAWTTRGKDSAKVKRVRVYASLVGIVFFMIIGLELIGQTLLKIVAGTRERNEYIEQYQYVIYFLIFILAAAATAYWKFAPHRENNKILSFWLSLYDVRDPNTLLVMLLNVQIFLYSILGGTFLLSAALAISDLGAIRAFAPFLIIACIYFTVFKNPSRLLVTFGVVLAFLATSFIYDGILRVVEYIETSTEVGA